MDRPQQLCAQVNISAFIFISTQANIYAIFLTLKHIFVSFGFDFTFVDVDCFDFEGLLSASASHLC